MGNNRDEYKSGHRDGAGFKKSSGGDPYVSGYRGGGEGDGGSSGPFPEKKGADCFTASIPVVVGIGMVGALARMALRTIRK